MSDGDRVRGPAMLAATNMLKAPPPVIGSVNKQVTLPRTIKLSTLVAVGGGAVFGFLVAFAIFGASLDALLYGPAFGGMLGWAVANFSPLPGESLGKWFGLQINSSRKGKLKMNGRPVRLYVGIAPLHRTAAGTLRILPGGVSIDAVNWDSRGVPKQSIPGADRLSATRAARVPKARRAKRLKQPGQAVQPKSKQPRQPRQAKQAKQPKQPKLPKRSARSGKRGDRMLTR